MHSKTSHLIDTVHLYCSDKIYTLQVKVRISLKSATDSTGSLLPMPFGETLAMTRLLAFTGLLLARDIGG